MADDVLPAHKLRTDDDGTVIVPLKGRKDVRLQEPSLDELDKIEELIAAADDALPKATHTAAQIRALPEGKEKVKAQDAMNTRSKFVYRERPHANAFLVIVNMLKPEGEEEVTTGHLFGWTINPTACGAVLDHWQRPFGGQSLLTIAQTSAAEQLRALTAAELV
jgi:hypothetical protein